MLLKIGSTTNNGASSPRVSIMSWITGRLVSTYKVTLSGLYATFVLLLSMAVGSLVVRASDSRQEGMCSMPDATKYPPSTHGVVKSVGPKVVWD
ncbi:hypothetical protein TNCV_1933231 [Trichonephila clavipes]|nr:hypothetical protein TNCV_1933231 [Trichonephila clavipes]